MTFYDDSTHDLLSSKTREGGDTKEVYCPFKKFDSFCGYEQKHAPGCTGLVEKDGKYICPLGFNIWVDRLSELDKIKRINDAFDDLLEKRILLDGG